MTFVIFKNRIISFNEDIKTLKPKQVITVSRLFWTEIEVHFNMEYNGFSGCLDIITADSADDMLAILEKKIREDFQKWLSAIDEKAAAFFYINTNGIDMRIFPCYSGTTKYINEILQVLEHDFKPFYSIIFNKLFLEKSLEEIFCEFYDKVAINVDLFRKYYGDMIIIKKFEETECNFKLDKIGIFNMAEEFVITDNLLREINFDKWKESFLSKCDYVKRKYEEMKTEYFNLPSNIRLILELENKGVDD